MSVSGVGASPQGAGNLGSSPSAGTPDGAASFLAYMKETPAERLEDSWLKAHGLTRQELAKMPPAEQKAVMSQMEQDIERQLKQAAENAANGKKPA